MFIPSHGICFAKSGEAASPLLRAFVEDNPTLTIHEEEIRNWVKELEGVSMTVQRYADQLRGGMFAGTLEMHITALLHQAQFQVFVHHKGSYNFASSTEPEQKIQGQFLLTGSGKCAHYDVFENFEDMVTEPEVDSRKEQPTGAQPRKKKLITRNKISLTRTTTRYNDICGVCGEAHTRRRASVKCSCGMFVHVVCLGFKNLREDSMHKEQVGETSHECKGFRRQTAESQKQASERRRTIRLQRVRATCLNLPITYTIASGCLASIMVAT